MSGPRRVMIIRHAEKPADDQNIHLSQQGWDRAAALVGLFGPGGRLAGVEYLIAAKRSKHSNRSVETLMRLSGVLAEDIDHGYDEDEYKELAKRIKTGKKYQGSTVLICWHHGTIPALAKALGVKASNLPSKSWPDEVFDRVWIIDFDPPGLVAIRSEPQGLDVGQ